MPWPCFLIEETPRARVYLRRFRWHERGTVECPGHFPYHDATVAVADVEMAELVSYKVQEPDVLIAGELYAGRFPSACECGLVFTEEDERQVFPRRLYRAADGREFTIAQAPPGAMWDAKHFKVFRKPHAPPDGLNLCVKLPDGNEWHIDGGSHNGPGWTRRGTPPAITCDQSISSPGYHGFLRDGVLTDDVEGRKIPAWVPPS